MFEVVGSELTLNLPLRRGFRDSSGNVLGCGGQPLIHFQLADLWTDKSDTKWVRNWILTNRFFLFTPAISGTWAGLFGGSGIHWLPLDLGQVVWYNFWIVEDTHCGPPPTAKFSQASFGNRIRNHCTSPVKLLVHRLCTKIEVFAKLSYGP